MQFKNLYLIGTSHIARESIREIKEKIESIKPGVVAVELDKERLYSLMHENPKAKVSYRSIFKVGVKGFLFALLGKWMSDKLGKAVGIKPGADMKSAVVVASKENIPVALIDQNISITLRRISKAFGWKEKWHFFVDALKGLFFKKKVMEEYGLDKFDLSKVPEEELIEKMLLHVKKRYPSLYKVLITERNKVMGKNLIFLMKKHPDKEILAVVGAGHKEGMIKYIKENFNKIEITS